MYKKLILGTLTALSLVAGAPTAEAGRKNEQVWCSKNADGSGICEANFLGFRNHPDDLNTLAYFRVTSSGIRNFSAMIQSESYSCVVPSGSTVEAMWPQVIAHRGYFRVSWNAAGTCQYLSLSNGSNYSNY